MQGVIDPGPKVRITEEAKKCLFAINRYPEGKHRKLKERDRYLSAVNRYLSAVNRYLKVPD